ncbi:MAG: hypothetical protein RQ847_04590, partial [Wenzhouxiangellaceae bacterium]|nr:hypothetical protein [Wenzhouxiangellaceae bacterium]
RRWTSIAGSLPDRHLVWRIVQDHVEPGLMFAATEFGIFATLDGGGRWTKMSGKLPTIAFRDLAIQRRENDLVGASFGRGFWVLDDYSVLREIDADVLEQSAALFSSRDAWWYIPRAVLGNNDRGSQGHAMYLAENPPFGAVFTYHLAEGFKTAEEKRREREKPLIEARDDVPFPGWEEVETERRQPDPAVLLIVRDADGNVVRRLQGPRGEGLHRVAWDLRLPAPNAIGDTGGFGEPTGFMVAPGAYTVELTSRVDGQATTLAGPREFEVVRMREGALEGAEPAVTAAFWKRLGDMQRKVSAATQLIAEARTRLDGLGEALARSTAPAGELDAELYAISQRLHEIAEQLQGKPSLEEFNQPQGPTIARRMFVAMIGTGRSTYGPTPTHEMSLDIAEREFTDVRAELNRLVEQRIPALEKALHDAGAPWTPGAPVPEKLE